MFEYNHQMIPYIILLFLVVSANAGFFKWIRDRFGMPGKDALTAISVFTALWALSSIGHILASTRLTVNIFLTFEEMFASVASLAWFVFACQHTGRNYHKRFPTILLLATLAFTPLLLGLTNQQHYLYWGRLTKQTEPFLHFSVGRGLGHFLVFTAIYILNFVGVYFVLSYFSDNRDSLFPHGVILVGLVGGLMGVNSLINVFNNVIVYSYATTLTSLGFTIFILVATTSLQYDVFRATPQVHRDAVETLDAVIFSVDENHRLIEYDSGFVERFVDDEQESNLKRRKVTDVAPDIADQIDFTDPGTQSATLYSGHNETHFHIEVSEVDIGESITAYNVSIRDVTDVVNSKRELDRHNEQLEKVARSVAHEFRNPLAVLIGNCSQIDQMIEQDEIDREKLAEASDTIRDHSERISEIADDFINLVENSRTLTRERWVSLGTTADDIVDILDIDYEFILVENGEIFCEKERLGAAIEIILREAAVYHSPPSEDTPIRGYVTDDGFEIEIWGEISSSQMDSMLSHGETAADRGKGLGMSVARSIVNSQGWSLEITTSDSDDSDASFTQFTITNAEARKESN